MLKREQTNKNNQQTKATQMVVNKKTKNYYFYSG